jgi:serine/threonine-protein kinase
LNEAQAAGRLHHPGIVAVFDVGEEPEKNDPYLVLEYVSGETLKRILARENKLPLEKALQLAIDIAEALDYAHAQGVVHRDIKPANILVTPEGRAKIADFGIAKLNLAHFTLPGRVLGTPAYMAPEQLSGEGVDGRSDLFSLGVILYALVTGHSPFQGSSATTVCFKVANREPVAASALDMTLPPELDLVIARAMAKDPDQRYQSGSELAGDLRNLQQREKPNSTSTSSAQVAAGNATRSNQTRTGKNEATAAAHVTAIEQGEKVVRHILFKVPMRDLALGAATIVLLVIAVAQSKLLVSSPSPKDDATSTAASTSAASIPAPVVTASNKSNPTADLSPVAVAAKPVVASAPKAHAKAPRPVKPVEVPLSTLDVAVQHQFKDATLYIWVDDKLELTRPLHGGAQKKLVVFNGVRGVDSETLKVPAGKHILRFRALSSDQSVDLSKTIAAEFAGGDAKSLQVTFDKHNAAMRLAWQ